jgi:hypothetical protein
MATAINKNAEHQEGEVAKKIENQTAKLPSDIFLWAATGVAAAALGLHCARQKHTGLLVGQWVAPILLLGIYNKLVKQQGHDNTDQSK